MKRVMLTVAYDGTNYHGWQIQTNGETIEGVLNRCLSDLTGERIEVIGASRTDSGVHAMGNVAVFDTDSPIPADKISYALNRRLPEDIRIRRSEEVPADFHPRHCVSRKTYEYRIYCADFPMPVKRLYSHYTYVPLDTDLMCRAAQYFVGTHDFKSFCSAEAQVETTVRQVESVEVWDEISEENGSAERMRRCNAVCGKDVQPEEAVFADMETASAGVSRQEQIQDREIVIRVTGYGFLYNMVRIMAGTLMEAGRGHIAPEDIKRILEARDRQAAGPTAPACGLTLIGIAYL